MRKKWQHLNGGTPGQGSPRKSNLTEEQLQKQRDYTNLRNRANPKKYLHNCARQRAERQGIEFTITPEDITIPEVCPVLGIPLIMFGPNGGTDNSASLDRMDNSKGYVPGNVIVISKKANQIKNNASPEDLMKVALWVSKNQG